MGTRIKAVFRLLPVLFFIILTIILTESAPVYASSPVIRAKPRYDWVWGQDWPVGETVTITIDGDGDPITTGDYCGSDSKTVDMDGRVEFAVWKFCDDLTPGQWVTMTDGGTEKKLHVQDVVVTRVEDSTNIVRGTGTEGAVVTVHVNSTGVDDLITTVAGGTWAVDFTPNFDLVDGSNGDASIFDDDGDATYFEWWVPEKRIEVEHQGEWGDWVIAKNWQIGDTITLTISGSVSYSDVQVADFEDYSPFLGEAWFDMPDDVDLLAGDLVEVTNGTTTKTHTITNLAIIEVEPGIDKISGTGTPGTTVYSNLHICCYDEIPAIVQPDGTWSISYAGIYDIDFGSSGNVRQYDIDRDSTAPYWGVPYPYVEAFPETDQVGGNNLEGGALVSLEINGGEFTDSQIAVGDDWNTYVNFDLGEFDLQAGDIVTLTQGSAIKFVEVIDLQVNSFNEAENTVSGTAPPGTNVQVQAHDYCDSRFDIIVESSGSWSVDFDDIGCDLIPNTHGDARVWDDDRDCTRVDWYVPNPHINAHYDGDWVEGFEWEDGVPLTLEIDGGPGRTYSNTKIPGPPDWDPDSVYVEFDLMTVFDIQVGDTLTMTQGSTVKSMEVTYLEVTDVDEEENTITGRTDPGTEVQVNVHECCGLDLYATADGSGVWSVDYDDIGYDLVPDINGDARVVDTDGDATRSTWQLIRPNFEVMGDTTIWYNGFNYNTYLTLTIDDPETAESPDFELTRFIDDPNEWNFDYDYPREPGFIFTFTDGVNTKTHVYRRLEKVWADPLMDTIYGFADVGEIVKVWSPYEGMEEYTVTVTNPDGSWEVDTTPEFDIPIEWFGIAAIFDDDGDATQLFWNTVYPHMHINLTNQEIILHNFPEFSMVNVTIEDNTDTVIFSEAVSMGPANWGNDPLTAVVINDGVDVQSGYTVTATDGTNTKVLTVSNLAIDQVDPLADTVSGTADPGSEVWIEVYGMGSRLELADASGNWFADFSVPGDEDWEEPYDIMYESGGEVSQTEEDLDSTTLSWWVGLPECPSGTDIVGTVYGADGLTPLEGAVVHFQNVNYPNEDVCSLTVGPDGIYSVELADGTYKLFADGSGYSRQYYPLTINESATPLTISDLNQHSGIDFTLDLPVAFYEHFVFNLNDPVISDPAVRQAIAYGTDRQRMIDETYFFSPVWDSYLPFYHWAYNPDVTTYPYDPSTATQILVNAGWLIGDSGIREKEGQTLTFDYVSPISPERTIIKNIFIENMTTLGIEVIECPWNQIFNQRDFGVAEFAWGIDLNEDWGIGGYLRVDDEWNFAGYNDLAADQLLDNANAVSTRADKLTYYQQHQAMIIDALPELPLFHRCQQPDSDCDGIVDWLDNADFAFNPDQGDIDEDGIGDVIDVCPSDLSDNCDADNSTAATIGEAGGTLTTPYVEMNIPPDALSDYTSISITDLGSGFSLETNFGNATAVFGVEIGPAGTVFSTPISITFTWNDMDNDGIVDEPSGQKESKLFIAKDGTAITPKCGEYTDCDMDLNTITFQVSSLSEFVLATVDNEPPVIETLTAPLDPVQIGTIVETSATFSDPDLVDVHTATWDWGDGSTSEAVVYGYTVYGSHPYEIPGVYTVALTVEDEVGESDTATFHYVVVYDPEGGFVTGGGWIWSPEGAYTPDPALTGEATFGFVSKYKSGTTTPTGNTEFQFQVADLNFKSSCYDWLVIAGTKAKFKGTGTINGIGDYGFMLSAIDATPDTFRIKIWDKATEIVIYDNQIDTADDADPETVLGGGSIVIHKAK